MEQVLNNLILLMSNGLATYVLYRFMYVFFDARQVRKGVAVAVYLLQFCISSFVMVKVSYPVVNMLASLFCNVLLVACYKGNIGKKIVVIFMIFAFGFGFEVMMAFVLRLGFSSMMEKVDINAIVTLMVQMEEWLLSLILEKCLKKSKKNYSIPWGFTIAVILEVFTVTILEITLFSSEGIGNNIKLYSVLCLVLICILIIYLYHSLSTIIMERTQNQLIKQERNFYHNQAEMLQENSEQIRKFHHDYQNKMLVLQGLLEKDDLEMAKKYLVEVTKKLEYVKAYSRTGNVILDSVINYKLSKAEEQGIDVTAEIKLPDKIKMEDDDMVVIMGNLLDNAIEATGKLAENRKIELNLAEIKGMLCIKVRNTFDGKVKVSRGKLRTRKEDSGNHGIGLDSVESIVKKYQGEMDVSYKDEFFTTALYLYQTNEKIRGGVSKEVEKL